MQDRFQACEPERLVALLDLDADAPPPTGSSFVADSDARTVLDPEEIPQIDGYDITGRLGEGGMGVVWRAVQRGTRRPVALKVRPQFARGGSRARLRFEREVELAARLEHPHVARVYDSGVCRGLDYYGMELIDGAHLDRYVADHKLKPRQILALMRDVCLAVHYAHQRGVIHRDLKPSNILVTNDGQPHVVDFGLAKALAEESDDPALTQEGQYAGTPAFMSPEQAAGQHDRIDTRTDVWGLGATLFLLLTGHTPHDTKGARYDVIRRVGSEEVRRPRALDAALDAEVEALLLKALAHDPDQRYGTAAELAQDIERYLTGEPLKAAPPSKLYRARKYATKHRWPIAVAAVFVVLLVGATVVSVRQARQIARERDLALAQKTRADEQAAIAQAVSQFQSEMLASADPSRLLGDQVTVLHAASAAVKELDAGKLRTQPLVEAAVRQTIGRTLLSLGRYGEAEPNLRVALDLRRRHLPQDHPHISDSLANLATLFRDQGRFSDAEPLFREAMEIHVKLRAEDRFELAMTMSNLATVLHEQGNHIEAEPLVREVMAMLRGGSPNEQQAVALHNLGAMLNAHGQIAESQPVLREALEVARTVFPDGHPVVAKIQHSLGLRLIEWGMVSEAEPLLRESLELRRHLLPPTHPDIAESLGGMATVLQRQRKFAEAESTLRESLDLRRRVLPGTHPTIAQTVCNFGELLMLDPKRGDEAAALLREALDLRRRTGTADDPGVAQILGGLARLRYDAGDLAGVEALSRESLQIYRATLPPTHPSIAISANNLARVLRDQNKMAEAEPLFREALAIDRKALPTGHPDLAHSIQGVAQVAYAAQNFAECEALAREAGEIFRPTVPATDRNRVINVLLLSGALQAQGRVDESIQVLEELRDPSIQHQLQPDMAAEFHIRYGVGLVRLGRWEQAEPSLRTAHEFLIQPRAKPHPRMHEVIAALVDLCVGTGRVDEAAQWREKLVELQATTQPATQPNSAPSSH